MSDSPSGDATAKIEKARKSGIRFVQLQFTDILGVVKAVTIPLHQMESSIEHGKWFDGSSVEGFTRIAESDQYLKPDMDTFHELPWQQGSGPRGTARVICDVFTPRGEPFAGDPRFVLRRQVESGEVEVRDLEDDCDVEPGDLRGDRDIVDEIDVADRAALERPQLLELVEHEDGAAVFVQEIERLPETTEELLLVDRVFLRRREARFR